jgi:phosphoribosylaminoimidazole carboxylase (NCAIR synthetase)
MQRYAWVFNLDAELELARGRPGYVSPRKLASQLATHGQSSRQLLGEADVEIGRTPPPPGALGRAWCPTPLALVALRDAGVEPEPHPEPSVLRRVNHRQFAHQLGGGLPNQVYVTEKEELLAALGDYRRHWLLKRPLGFAGRGQLRVLGPLSEKQWTWVDASLERDGLLVEPLVRPALEVSLHGFSWQDGRFELGRVCVQDVAPRGAFQRVRLAERDELVAAETSALYERAEATARALHAAGYFGPFGIDGYRYEAGFCALGELNARYTLSFSTGFPRRTNELVL